MKRPVGYWDHYFLDQARHVASASKDPSTQCGCVIVSSERRILATGYNGFPTGVEDADERYENRDLKYKLVVHSEANAIASAALHGVSIRGAIAYVVGLAPCHECMKLLIQAGIKRVVWPKHFTQDPDKLSRWQESFQWTFLLAREAGVTLEAIE